MESSIPVSGPALGGTSNIVTLAPANLSNPANSFTTSLRSARVTGSASKQIAVSLPASGILASIGDGALLTFQPDTPWKPAASIPDDRSASDPLMDSTNRIGLEASRTCASALG